MNGIKLNILISSVMAIMLLSGCASKGIEITDNSSDELRLLKEEGFTKARDLTRDEFEEYAEDRQAMEQGLTRSFEESNRTAGGMTGAAVGAITGMGIGQFALFGAAGADGEDKRYSFYKDYGVSNFLIKSEGQLKFEKIRSVIDEVVKKYGESFKSKHSLNEDELVTDDYTSTGKYTTYEYINSYSGDEVERVIVGYTMTGYDNDNDNKFGKNKISLDLHHYIGEYAKSRDVHYLQTFNIYKNILKELDGSFKLYLQPNKTSYRLPMIIYGGDGSHSYLVEKE
ncbi:hypothetical protein [Marinospirillum sp.]|uniref:hypothetical protein n=1 Tax=Marinospirillum sp. TaxID=2183934 RepID=UPI00286FC163|nr:hypothetical protein [Marinospirillum sp.]MDR9467989.1 hypothetical protein [Marinospirillum sp.]